MPTYAYINTTTQLVVSTLLFHAKISHQQNRAGNKWTSLLVKYAKINKILMAENIADQFDKHEITS